MSERVGKVVVIDKLDGSAASNAAAVRPLTYEVRDNAPPPLVLSARATYHAAGKRQAGCFSAALCRFMEHDHERHAGVNPADSLDRAKVP